MLTARKQRCYTDKNVVLVDDLTFFRKEWCAVEQTVLTNMCMVYERETGRVVVQYRRGKWGGCAFPGGHVEPGEAFVPSVIREVWEETGLRIQEPKLCGVKHWVMQDGARYIVFLYATDRFSGELIGETHEGKVEWVLLEKLPSLSLASTFLPMAEIMAEGLGVPFQNRHPGSHEYFFEPQKNGETIERFY